MSFEPQLGRRLGLGGRVLAMALTLGKLWLWLEYGIVEECVFSVAPYVFDSLDSYWVDVGGAS